MKILLGLMLILPVCLGFLWGSRSSESEGDDWDNSYDEVLYFTCPSNQAIYKVKSIHSNQKNDRKFKFSCRRFPYSFSRCYWTDYINDFDQPFCATCPYNGIVAGAYSRHSNSREDRRWQFYCCESNDYYVTNCHNTPYAHNLDGQHDYSVQSSYWIHGAGGHHDNLKEDRLWTYNVCQVRPN